VRSIIHDIALALGSTAHVVKLTRTRQGQFALEPSNAVPDSAEASTEVGCVEWTLLEAAIKAMEESKKGGSGTTAVEQERDAEGLLAWEADLLSKCQEV
jgi:tRNA pseudouridine55 synthase